MKSFTKALCILLFAALPFSLFGQNTTVIAAFMKVTLGHESEYLEVEQTWKEFHQRAEEEGVYHLEVGVDNPQAMKYLVIMRNHIPPDRSTEYYTMEREIFKPFQEEMIRGVGSFPNKATIF